MQGLLERSKFVKQCLTDFVMDAEGELAVALEKFCAEGMRFKPQDNMSQQELLIDRFLIEGKVGDKTVIQLFQDDGSSFSLTPEDRQLLAHWHRSFIGLFMIQEISEGRFKLMNMTTAKTYVVIPNDVAIAAAMERYKPGEILLVQITPLDEDNWIFSSPCTSLGKLGKPKLAVAVGNFKKNYPQYLYSDAEDLLEQAWQSVEKFYREFVDFFGGPEVTLSGYELGKKLQEFQKLSSEKQLQESGLDPDKSLEELAVEAGLSAEELEEIAGAMGSNLKGLNSKAMTQMVQPQIELPPNLKKAENVTILAHPRWGQVFLSTYRQFETLLQSTDPESIPGGDKLVKYYLESPEINILPWKYLARKYPEALEKQLRDMLDRPDFTIETHLMPLLAQYNKAIEPTLPEIASVPLHLHNLFQDAVLEVNKAKVKEKNTKGKTNKGFKKS
ncbi:MAG: hypothetical protein N5P05_001116 [Chroococcopsis gigantea SAG 12.99]|jgi:hypothetical protein|nr:hypothetical protein [Chlorogloea purpurea SAG 13.99]MDV2999510.1 hypothetical protein [Chroococcopsis gigantea SAG 12.99]